MYRRGREGVRRQRDSEVEARLVVIWISAVLSCLGLPGGRMLLGRIQTANPLVVAGAVLALLAVAVIYVRTLRREARE